MSSNDNTENPGNPEQNKAQATTPELPPVSATEQAAATTNNEATPPADQTAAKAEDLRPLLPKRKTLSIIIHDSAVLRAAYMQFIKGGGIFIPTKKPFKMGEDTNLVIRLLDEDEPYRVSGKVVWITPLSEHSSRAGGIGVEFAEDKNGERLRSRIELILGPHLKSTESTHTM